ncbi:MAG: hypothetical protein ACOC44_11180 [Promethearchaeia archaeon]
MPHLEKNIEYSINGTMLTVKIDLSKNLGESKSGKSQIIATSRGNKALTGKFSDVKIGINCYRPL